MQFFFSKPQTSQSTKIIPSHHANATATSFRNPWSQSKGLLASGQVFNASNFKFPLEWAKALHDHPHMGCEVRNPDFGKNLDVDEGTIKATWLGHAGFIVEMCRTDSSEEPIRILFDPIWSDRASPSQRVGPRRFLSPPCPIKDLPEFHFVVTSHNHYDHLDWPTIQSLYQLRGSRVHFLAPLGNKAWFCAGGIPPSQVTEMDWWDEVELTLPGNETSSNPCKVKFICTPAQHGSGRSIHDQRAALWASWVVQQRVGDKTASVYHAGDTGYMTESGPCPAFKEIGDKYGPFDLALLPIWRGGSLSFIAAMGLRLVSTDLTDGLHASPAHALLLHKDIRSRHSIAMHFGTFAGSELEAMEPIVELLSAKDKHNDKVETRSEVESPPDGGARRSDEGDSGVTVGDWKDENGFGVIDVGETVVIPITEEVKEKLGGKAVGSYYTTED